MTKHGLLHCDDLFMKYFDRWYDDGDRKRKGFKATCPDVMSKVYKAGIPAAKLTPLLGETLTKVAGQVKRMVESAKTDWESDYGVTDPISLGGLNAFDKVFNRKKIQEVIDRSDPEDFSNEYLVVCCELGATLGTVLRSLRPDFEWIWEWPYWESSLYDSATTDQYKVFHWAIKKMSDYGVNDGLEAKVKFAAEQPWKKEKS